MFGGSIIQQDHVNVVVKYLFLRWSSRSPFQHQLNPMLVMSCPAARNYRASVSDAGSIKIGVSQKRPTVADGCFPFCNSSVVAGLKSRIRIAIDRPGTVDLGT